MWPSSGPSPTAPRLPVLGAPDLDVVLHLGPRGGGVEEDNPLLHAAGHSFSGGAQDATGLLDCKTEHINS